MRIRVTDFPGLKTNTFEDEVILIDGLIAKEDSAFRFAIMMLITRKDISDTASDMLEGPSTLFQRVKFCFHLMICVHCRRYLKQIRHSIGVTQKISSPPEPGDAEVGTLISKLKS